MAAFGEQLRLAREARGITLKEISERTRISVQYLDAIEKDNYKVLPGGLFNRSFVKAYARSVGFDESEAIDAYKRISHEQGYETQDVPIPQQIFQVGTDDNVRSPLVTALLTGIILLVVSLGIYAGLHWYLKRGIVDSTNNQVASPNNPNSSTNSETTLSGTTANVAAPSATPTTDQNANSNTSQLSKTEPFKIQIKAKEKVWIKTISDSDEATTFKGVLTEDETKDLTLQQELKIEVAKEKVKALTVTINGQPVKLQYQTSARKAEAVITREDYQQPVQ